MPEPLTVLGVGSGLMGLLVHLARRYFEAAKEVVDTVLGALVLVAVLPLLGVCAVLIKLASPGPVLLGQVRVGRGGKPFTMYKLRTMYRDAESRGGATWASRHDPRVVPACRWMRASHVDELPQLINVIKGQMSLVGPRPERPEILDQLREQFPNLDERLAVRPGITGLAQVKNGYDTDVEHFRRKLDLDLEYVQRRSWGRDFLILLLTFPKLHDKAAH